MHNYLRSYHGFHFKDMAGEGTFGSVARVYYKNAWGAFIVYDAQAQSLETVKKVRIRVDKQILLKCKCYQITFETV